MRAICNPYFSSEYANPYFTILRNSKYGIRWEYQTSHVCVVGTGKLEQSEDRG